ncbi:uncharacterized protein LOC141719804 [Apium graveolens]|uniref:uncharacterized protein LOC141719804 n=1 Tax=Apium graveolens TaxID=4045 RepID=UPI003D7A8907
MTMLLQKRVHVPGTYPVCGKADEIIMRVLLSCSFASQCWQRLIPKVCQDLSSEFYTWLESVLNAVSKEKNAVVATVCWAIWKARNEKDWNQKQTSINGVIASANNTLYFGKMSKAD